MSKKSMQIYRKDLYEQVWEVPILKLAEQYGISGVGLAKVCKKHNIPRPPRGYWAKKYAGAHVQKASLPNQNKNYLITINANSSSCRKDVSNNIKNSNILKEEIAGIHVFKRLSDPHPLIEKTRDILNQSQVDQNGLLVTISTDCLNIKVSSQSVSRALRILDSLLKHLQKQGFDIYIKNGNTVINIDNIEIHVGIREELKKEMKPVDLNLEGYYHFRHNSYQNVFVPSGNLCLSVLNHYSDGHLQKNWRDTARKQLEDQLDKFLMTLLKIVAEKKEAIRQQEERELQRRERQKRLEEQRRKREELQERIDHEQNRVAKLIEDAENWKKSMVLKEFIYAVEKQAEVGECCYKPDTDWEEWLKWAKNQADRLNPLAPSPPSILDEKISEIEDDSDF